MTDWFTSGSLRTATDITQLVHRSSDRRRAQLTTALATDSDVVMSEDSMDQWMDHDRDRDDDDGEDDEDADAESVDSEEDGLRQLLLLQQTKYHSSHDIISYNHLIRTVRITRHMISFHTIISYIPSVSLVT